MIELVFNSILTEEEIEDNFANIDFFDGLKSALEEVLRYEREKLN